MKATRIVAPLALILTATAAIADDMPPANPWIGTIVIARDTFVLPRVGRQLVYPARPQHRFRVEQVQGDWLWVSAPGVRGWVHRGEVVPFESAVDYFTAVIRSHPYSAGAYYLRGLAWAERGEPDIAVADFTEAARRDMKNAWAFHARGDAYRAKHDYGRAIDDYDEAVRLNPPDAMAYNNRGLAHRELGDIDRAIADFNEAIRRDPHAAEPRDNRAGALRERQAGPAPAT